MIQDKSKTKSKNQNPRQIQDKAQKFCFSKVATHYTLSTFWYKAIEQYFQIC